MPATGASSSGAAASKPSKHRDARPPAKKTKRLHPSEASPNGLNVLLNGALGSKNPLTAKTNAVQRSRKDRIDEATAAVGGGVGGHGDVDRKTADREPIELSSGDEDSDDSSSEEEEDEAQEESDAAGNAPVTNGDAYKEDLPMEDGTAEPEELSFGERLQAQEPEPVHAPNVVDVEAAFMSPTTESRALATASSNRPLSAPSASSLGTVLTQALRTNDQELLESCLRVIDVDTIYATVERLPSPLVGNLLQKLAERLHKRPGRAGMLMIWVQWSLAAHGGYLASQPQLVQQLATLNKVLKERASGLQPLLSLKGRLDMLHAQLELRRRNQIRAAKDEEDEAVIYVEGEDDSSSEEDARSSVGSGGNSRKRIRQSFDEEEDESSVDEMPTTMEVNEDDSDEVSEGSEGLLDDEAEETENDTGDDMSEPMSDDDIMDGQEGSESEEESRPARRSTVGRAGHPRRF